MPKKPAKKETKKAPVKKAPKKGTVKKPNDHAGYGHSPQRSVRV